MKDEEKQKNYELAEKLIAEESLTAAAIAGAFTTLLAAVAYGITVATWPFSYGFAVEGFGIFRGPSAASLRIAAAHKFRVTLSASDTNRILR